MEPPAIDPDTRDWTFTITDGCEECGFDPAYDVTTTGSRTRTAARGHAAALRRTDARERPTPNVWSPLEYGCHVRDVCRLFGERLALMLAEDDPAFDNWDQDRAAVEDRYWAQVPADVAVELVDAAESVATAFDAVDGDQWERTGRRSNGSRFTVRTLATYFLHDVEHHLHDVRQPEA